MIRPWQPGGQPAPMTPAAIMIIGKLVLTFGLLLGLPLFDLYRLRRDQHRS